MFRKRIILSLLANGVLSLADIATDNDNLFAENEDEFAKKNSEDIEEETLDDQDFSSDDEVVGRSGLQLVLTLDGGAIGRFEENDGNSYGASFGYSLNIGYMPASYISFYTGVNALMGSVDHSNDEELTDTSFADVYLGTKLYPLGERTPHFYLNLGYIPYSAFHFSDEFVLVSDEEGRRTYRGHGYLFGIGYEHPINNKIFLLGEAQLRYHEYNRRATSDGEISLNRIARGNVYLAQFGLGLLL